MFLVTLRAPFVLSILRGGQGEGEIRIADGRVSFILLRKAGAWKVIHYHESRPGPL